MIKVLYINYENLYKTSILQAMVVKPLDIISKNHNVKFVVTSACKDFERDEIYFKNKNFVESQTNIDVVEFKKNLKPNQSILTFIKDIFPIIKFVIKESKKFDLIHCRSYGSAVIGFIASKISGVPYIFDIRGLLPEETVELGKIKSNSFKFRLLKFAEKILLKNSDYNITVSKKFTNYIKSNFKLKNVSSISNPTDFNMFTSEGVRHRSRVNFIYSGSLQKWHLPNEVIKYFEIVQKKFGDKVHLKFCTNNIEEAILLFQNSNLPSNCFTIKNVPFNEIGEEYSSADIGFCLIKNSFSKAVCFPVKFSEYIASNIFVITNRGIGDLPQIVEEYNCGIVIDDVNDFNKNGKELINLVQKFFDSKIMKYNKSDLPFLDWNKEGSSKLIDIYNKVLYQNGKCINSSIQK